MLISRYEMTLMYTVLAFAYGVSSALANHPFHVSTAEVEYNPKTNRLEVGLKCQAMDLERAIQLLAKKKLDIESDSQVDELVTRYVTENFFLAAAPLKERAKLLNKTTEKLQSDETDTSFPEVPKESIKFVGKEFETKWIWIYFELQPPAGDEPLVLVNRVLFEVNAGQINTCLIRRDGKRHALKSSATQPLQDFDRTWLTESKLAESR